MPFDFFKYDYNLDGALHYPFVFDFKGINAISFIDVVLSGVSPLVLENAIQLNYLKVFGGTEQRNLPSGYTQLEYIESDGTQYIDIAVSGNATFIGTAQSTTDSPTTSQVLVANGGASAGRWFGVQAPNAGEPYSKRWGLGATSSASSTIYGTTKVDFNITFSDVDGQYGTINNETLTRTSSKPTQGDWIAFAGLANPYWGFIGKVWKLQAVQNNVLVRDFVPCKNSSNIAGMYDLVSGRFFGSLTASNFVAGPDAVPTPDKPMDIVCNNGTIKFGKKLTLDSTRYYAYLSVNLTDWSYSNDSFSIVVPVTVGKKYKIAVPTESPLNGLQNTIFRYAFTDSINTDWTRSDLTGQTSITAYDMVRTTPQDTPSAEVTATHPYMIIQMGQAAFSYILANNLITVTDQTIYTDGTAETIALNGGTATAEMLLKVGDYQDVQSILDGAVTRNVGIKVLDGTEDWTYSNSRFRLRIADYLVGSSIMATIISHYKLPAINVGSIANGEARFGKPVSTDTVSSDNILIVHDDNYTDLNSYKAWLASQYAAGTPVIVVYPLATPTTESVTGQTLTASGNCTAEITQASINNLTMELGYRKQA